MRKFIKGGYSVKNVVNRPAWLESANVKKIFSVSECISKCPIDHYTQWRHNELLLYNAEQDLSIIIEKNNLNLKDLTWFYYEIYEKELHNRKWTSFTVKDVNVEKANGYQLKGYDIVGYSTGNGHECSPLSCNHGALKFEVNEMCLVDLFDDTFMIAEKIDSDGGYEPGPYRIVSVYERTQNK